MKGWVARASFYWICEKKNYVRVVESFLGGLLCHTWRHLRQTRPPTGRLVCFTFHMPKHQTAVPGGCSVELKIYVWVARKGGCFFFLISIFSGEGEGEFEHSDWSFCLNKLTDCRTFASLRGWDPNDPINPPTPQKSPKKNARKTKIHQKSFALAHCLPGIIFSWKITGKFISRNPGDFAKVRRSAFSASNERRTKKNGVRSTFKQVVRRESSLKWFRHLTGKFPHSFFLPLEKAPEFPLTGNSNGSSAEKLDLRTLAGGVADTFFYFHLSRIFFERVLTNRRISRSPGYPSRIVFEFFPLLVLFCFPFFSFGPTYRCVTGGKQRDWTCHLKLNVILELIRVGFDQCFCHSGSCCFFEMATAFIIITLKDCFTARKCFFPFLKKKKNVKHRRHENLLLIVWEYVKYSECLT